MMSLHLIVPKRPSVKSRFCISALELEFVLLWVLNETYVDTGLKDECQMVRFPAGCPMSIPCTELCSVANLKL